MKMKYVRTDWWVEYEFVNGVAMCVKVFKNREEAEKFAKEHDSKVLETKCYKC